jgi:hypothetical protein
MARGITSALLAETLLAGVLWGQTNRAIITGTVTDPSGAVVAGASVSATNKGTNVQTKTVSNGVGIYVLPDLPPGQYSVEFEMSGFESVAFPSVTLESTQVARMDVALKVGAVSASIKVTSDAPILEQERPSFGNNMKASVVDDLPLNIGGGGRGIEDFAVALTPGYSPYSNAYGAVINGGQWFTKDYTIDGTSGTADIQGDSIETQPSFEAIEELQATTSGLDADSSITGGGVMAFTLKSGTNRFHGSAYNYGHNEAFDANTWTNNNQGLPRGRDRTWNYGGSLGGPIFKNKAFFFGTFDRVTTTDFRLGGLGPFVPTSDMLNGNFSALLGAALCTQADGSVAACSKGGTAITVQNNAGQTVPLQAGMIFDPQTGNQFAGNMIPSSRFSAVAQKINGIFQKDYAPEAAGLSANNRIPSATSPSQTPNQAVVKLDHNLSERDRLSGSWIYDHRPRTLEDSGGIWQAGTTDGGPLSAARLQLVRSHQYRATESHTFAPNVINVFNATYNWYWNGSLPASSGTNWPQTLGLGNTGASNFPLIGFGNSVNGYGVTYIGNSWQGHFVGDTLIADDSVTWTKGRHSFKFGGDLIARQINSHAGSGALNFSFSNNTTGAPSAAYSSLVGFGFASYLLGDVTTAGETTPFDLYGRQKSISFFAQDNWKVTSKLTLNLGLRWVYNFRFHEKYGHWANYDLTAIDPTLGIPGTLVFAKNGSDSFQKNEYLSNFGPDVGFAYSPWKKWVFRGSYNMVYFPVGAPYFNGVPEGFAPGFQGTNVVNTPFNWDAGYPGVFKSGNKNVDPSTIFPLVNVDPRALHVGYSLASNIGAQYELTPNMRLEVAYVGNRGHRLTDTALAWNEGPTPTFLRLTRQYPDLNSFNHYVCSPADAASYGVSYPYSGFCAPVLAAIAPNPQAADWASTIWYYYNLNYVGLPLGQSFYNSLVVDWVKRTGRGLTLDLNYAWSRQESDTFSAQQEYNGYYTGIQDFGHLSQAAHTVTGYDLAHIVKGFVSCELPFGKGQRWLANHGRVANGFLGGWIVTAIVGYNSGQPFVVSTSGPYYYPLWGAIYPDFNLSGFRGTFGTSQFQEARNNAPVPAAYYMPSNVASNPPIGQLGNAQGVSPALRCPGNANENVSLLKNFSMGSEGRYRLQFRTEFYNLFNRHTYSIEGCGGIHATIGASNFGQILGVPDTPRGGQFALRFEF